MKGYKVREGVSVERYNRTQSDDCHTCGARWRRGSLSRPRPECPVCEERICDRCRQIRCFGCDALLHHGCAVLYGEDLYCARCAKREEEIDRKAIADLMGDLSLEELLVASIAIVNYRKGAAA